MVYVLVMTETLLSVADAATALGVHRTRVNQLIGGGLLPASRIGRSFIIRQADLDLVKERPSPGRPAKAKPTEDESAEVAKIEADAPTIKKPKAGKSKPAKKAGAKAAKASA